MTQEAISISKNPDIPLGMKYTFLKETAISYIQKLGGDVWTDYNAHDPGVTILESLCYAITELCYKANIDIKTILFAEGADKFSYNDFAIYFPEELFSSAPVTLMDYRKLLIDQLYPEVRNAWLFPAYSTPHGVNIQGMYKVHLQIAEVNKATTKESLFKIKDRCRKLMAQNRNLCEDLLEVAVLDPHLIGVSANIYLQTDAIGELVLGKVVFELMKTLTPQLQFYSKEKLLENGHSLEEIYEGPPTKHGFLDNRELAQSELHIINTLYVANIIRTIASVDGVSHILNLAIKKSRKDILEEDTSLKIRIWTEVQGEDFIQLEENTYPVISIDYILDNVKLFIGETEYTFNKEDVKNIIEINKAEHYKQYQHATEFTPPVIHSEVEKEELLYYHSIQHSLPETYGVGEYGVPQKSLPERKAYVQQLKGYLLLFEQIMADYLAQLANINNLFDISSANEISRTYFSQIPVIPNPEEVIGGIEKELEEEILPVIARIYDKYIPRKNRFLDHLLARFSETFMSVSFSTMNRQAKDMSEEEYDKELINAKALFLQKYISLSRNKAKGINYLPTIFEKNTFLQTDFAQRVGLLCNIYPLPNHKIAEIPEILKFRKASAKLLEQKENRIAVFNSQFNNIREELLLNGTKPDFYIIEKFEGKFRIRIKADSKKCKMETQPVYYGKTFEECEAVVGKIRETLKKINRESENFYVLEHILLRPISPLKHSFIVDKNGAKWIYTESVYENNEKNTLEKFSETLLNLATQESNFILPITKSGESYIIVIADENKSNFAFVEGKFKEKKPADLRDEIIKELKLIKANTDKAKRINSIVERIRVDEDFPPGAIFDDDPYSLTLSAVLPDWTGRFQNDKIRAIFKEIFLQHVPAHLKVQFFWINIEKMKGFENYYFRWLEEKKSGKNMKMLDDLSYLLVMLLRYYEHVENESNIAQDALTDYLVNTKKKERELNDLMKGIGG